MLKGGFMRHLTILLFLLFATVSYAGFFAGDNGVMVETGTGDKEGWVVAEYTNQQIEERGNILLTERNYLQEKVAENDLAINKWQEIKQAYDGLFNSQVNEEMQ